MVNIKSKTSSQHGAANESQAVSSHTAKPSNTSAKKQTIEKPASVSAYNNQSKAQLKTKIKLILNNQQTRLLLILVYLKELGKHQ